MNPESKNVVVAYLSRYQDKDSEKLFSRFVESYHAHSAGYLHELVIAKKGYQNHQDAWEKRIALLKDVPFTVQEVSDFWYEPWREILDKYSDRYVLCLNAHSAILVDNWLNLYMRHAKENRVLGATGCNYTYHPQWESKYHFGHPKITLRRQPRKWFSTKFRDLSATLCQCITAVPLKNPFPLPPTAMMRSGANLFPPNVPDHVKWPKPETLGVKMCAYYHETGYYGFNGQIVAHQLEALIVGADGRATPLEKSWSAETFCCGKQKNLIIGDNLTRAYNSYTTRKKRSDEKVFWGTEKPSTYPVFDIADYENENFIPCPICGHKRTFPFLIKKKTTVWQQ